MARTFLLVCAAALAAAGCALRSAALDPSGEEPITFTAMSGDSVEAFRGTFEVPENRADPESRTLTLVYVRFPATGDHPGAPIVYLAGGPGGSGIATAERQRFPLFMAMREFGDVLAFDQRGTGASNDAPGCTSSIVLLDDQPGSIDDAVPLYAQALEECAVFWRDAGIDIAGYTTTESVQDLDALRRRLGADKITLWGISYGSHLALAALKDIDAHIDRVVIASAEGLDQTVKLPAETDAYFARLQAAIDAEPAAKATYPDIAALMRRVHARLDAEPILLAVPQRDGSTADVMLTADLMRSFASAMIADPGSAAQLLAIYAALDAGVTAPIVGLLQAYYRPNAPIDFEAMPTAMDIASGISPARRALVEAQARTALLGDLLNFPMPQLAGALGLDLGEAFRTPPESAVPTLLLTGTLDGRTYIPEQRAAVAGLANVTQVMVVNAGHNLFMTSPEVTEVIEEFMRGAPPHTREVIVPPPDFAG